MLITILCGCMADPPKGDKLKADLEESFYFQQYGLKIDSVTVDKRQTNKETEKTDTVYCTVVASTETYQVTESIIGQYIYYDEGGWILENVQLEGEAEFIFLEELNETLFQKYFSDFLNNPEFLGTLQFEKIEIREDYVSPSLLCYATAITDFGYATILSDCEITMYWNKRGRKWEYPHFEYIEHNISFKEEYNKQYTVTSVSNGSDYRYSSRKKTFNLNLKVDNNVATLRDFKIDDIYFLDSGGINDNLSSSDVYDYCQVEFSKIEIDNNFNIAYIQALLKNFSNSNYGIIGIKNFLSISYDGSYATLIDLEE